MLSDRLAAELEVTDVLLEREDYLLARVRDGETGYIAEVTPSPTSEEGTIGGNPSRRMSYPEGIQGVIYPVTRRKLPSGDTLLLFRDSSGFSQLLEKWASGPLGVDTSLALVEKLCPVVRKLHDNGHVLGYVGPEMIMIDSSGRPHIRAGRIGVPNLPFSAPEAIGLIPRDPRSDSFALGTLLFRLIAGTDDRNRQIDAWNSLGSGVSGLIEKMVRDRPSGRFPNLLRLSREIADVRAEIAGLGRASSKSAPDESSGVVTPGHRGRPGRPVRIILPVVLVLALVVLVLAKPWSCGAQQSRATDAGQGPLDSTAAQFIPPIEPVEEIPDSIAGPDSATIEVGPELLIPSDELVIWVSNYSGVPGAATGFRSGPAAGYSQVYPSTGQGTRTGSVIMCRRSDPLSPLSAQAVAQHAESLSIADSIADVRPVDISLLLGRDLSHSGLNDGFLNDPVEPACTLFIEVVNYGLQYALEGLGAATWASAQIDGRALSHDGVEYLLLVTDTRDGDRLPNEELGLSSPLEETLFIYAEGVESTAWAESVLRQFFQALPDQTVGPPADLPVPDLWVLLGSD